LKYLGGFVLLGFVLYQYGTVGNGWTPFALYVTALIGGYAFSCWRHPRRPCWYCGGKGNHKGFLWMYADRKCLRCDGGKRLRLGARVFGRTMNSPT
jgi:hypothetical protein